MSYPLTGSTGDGYRFARQFGHTVTPLRASLVPLESNDPWCAEMQGFSLRNVTLTVYDEHNKQVYSDLGEMLLRISASPDRWSCRQARICATSRSTPTACPST